MICGVVVFDIYVACFLYRGSTDFVEPQFAFSIAHYTKCRLKDCIIGSYGGVVCFLTLHEHYTHTTLFAFRQFIAFVHFLLYSFFLKSVSV